MINPGVVAILLASGYAFYLSQQNAEPGTKLLTSMQMEYLRNGLILIAGILTGQVMGILLNL